MQLTYMQKKHFTILIHLLGWTAFFVFPFVLVSFPGTHPQFKDMPPPGARPALLPFFLINNILFIALFYFNLFYLLPEFYYKHKRKLYFAIMFGLLLLAVYLPSFIKTMLIQPMLHHGNHGAGRHFKDVDRVFGFLHFLITWFLSSIISLSQRYRKVEQWNKEIKVQKLDAELSYLKAQINPHFLFNTLNNIYSMSICQSEQTPEAILKLSSIMRYVTQDAEAEKVPLEKELEYLHNYIDLQQLRSNTHLDVRFSVTGDIHNKTIAPLLLINFIENAFKHGTSNHTDCFIHIDIRVIEQELTMEVSNKKMNELVMAGTETGSNNTRRRLQLQYPGRHQFTIEEKDDLYKVTLQLNLA